MKTLVRLSLISLIGSLGIWGLYRYSLYADSKDRNNGFNRKLPSHMISDLLEFDLGVNSYYISGFTPSGVYLGNHTVPDKLVRLGRDLKERSDLSIPIAAKDTLWGAISVRVDSPEVIMSQQRPPRIRAGRLDKAVLNTKILKELNLIFFKPISSSSVIGKVFDVKKQSAALIKINLSDSADNKKFVLTQDQGLFASDGIVTFQPGSKYIFYVYYYENRFVCLDTNMNLVYNANTIDTFSTPQLAISKIMNNTAVTVATPAPFVNRASCVDDSLLFIHSVVKANNETFKGFKHSMAIDVYFVRSGRYVFSFYLPLYKGYRCSDIQVHQGRIYAIYDRYLISLKLNSANFRIR